MGFRVFTIEVYLGSEAPGLVPHADLERVGLEWAATICGKSPTAPRMLKFAFNAVDDGLVGQ